MAIVTNYSLSWKDADLLMCDDSYHSEWNNDVDNSWTLGYAEISNEEFSVMVMMIEDENWNIFNLTIASDVGNWSCHCAYFI